MIYARTVSWQNLTIVVAGTQAELLCDALLELGALCIDVSDADAGTAAEQAVFGEPGIEVARWARSRIRVLFASEANAYALLADACARIGLDCPAQFVLTSVEEQDWVRLTQSQFKPIRISDALWIVPSWETAPDPAAVNICLDPGVAFGTGSHATTRLCLQWLARNVASQHSVMDYGCGSGILAITAARLGASRVRGVDIDPQAVLAARANAMQNRVVAEFFEPDAAPHDPSDIVFANILANPLIALAPRLAALTRSRGHVVLSGILDAQAAEVLHAYRPWFDIRTVAQAEDWVLLCGRRVV